MAKTKQTRTAAERRQARLGYAFTTYSTRTGKTTLTVIGPERRVLGERRCQVATMTLDRESAIALAAVLLNIRSY